MPSAKDAALALALLYAAVLTYMHFGQRVNPICARDFVDPKLRGSCFSGADGYSMCTPSLAADVIIELLDEHGDVSSLVFIVRGDGRGLAIVGGFVRVGESAEAAAAREALEESGLAVEIEPRPVDAYALARAGVPMTVVVYAARWAAGEARCSEEHDEARWVDLEGFRALGAPARLVEAAGRALAAVG